MSTVEQRDRALAIANEVRLANAATLQSIRVATQPGAGQRVAAILRNPVGAERALRVGRLVRAIPGVGSWRAAKLLAGAGIGDEHRRLDEISPGRRAALAFAVGQWR